MKWPKWLMLIRHDTSEYNILKELKEKDMLYQSYLKARAKDESSQKTINLALKVNEKFALKQSDALTRLADTEGTQAYKTGLALKQEFEVPDVIFVSPYFRATETLRHISRGWTELKKIKVYEDDRIREQEHGLAALYNDWKVFQTLHPEQKKMYDREGRYWYRYPQGENVPDVRQRDLLWMSTVIRDFAKKKVLVVTHHLNILAVRANLERMNAAQFIHLDENDKPLNSGVTLYHGNPEKGSQGKLELTFYNKKYY